MTLARLYLGDAQTVLRQLEAESVQTVVTSPPYWGLRDYGVAPRVWDGDAACVHEWGDAVDVGATNHTDKRRWAHGTNGRGEQQPAEKLVAAIPTEVRAGCWCVRCGAWLGCLGLEPSPELWVDHLVQVFRDVRRVLKKDGTLWVNLGDCYVDGGRGGDVGSTLEGSRRNQAESRLVHVRNESFRRDRRAREDDPHKKAAGLKPKDLVGMPWMVAFALRADGWTLRDDIIWQKPNPMPESVTDRPTRAHEYLFLFSKSRRYYYNASAIAEDLSGGAHSRGRGVSMPPKAAAAAAGSRQNPSFTKAVSGWDTGPGDHDTIKHTKPRTSGNKARKFDAAVGRPGEGAGSNVGRSVPWTDMTGKRNSRSVWALPWSLEDAKELLVMLNSGIGEGDLWNIPIQPYAGAHFATFPTELAKRCILAGSRPGDVVADPFGGRGTVSRVAVGYGRGSVYIDVNPAYLELAREFIGPALCESVA